MAARRNRTQSELVRALSHPTRLGILVALRGRVASPLELAREMDQSPNVISYHASALVDCGCLELIHTEARRGSVERYFAVTPGSPL